MNGALFDALSRDRAAHRTSEAGGVVVVHPGRQHAYEVVRTALEVDILRAFATGVFLSERSGLRHAIECSRLARHVSSLQTALAQRNDPAIDPAKVVAFPAPWMIARAARPLPRSHAVDRWADRRSDARIARWLGELSPPPAIVHGFEGSCLTTFRASRKLGCRIVLDVPNAHEQAQRVLAEEGGRPAPRYVTRRLLGERALADRLVVPSSFVRDSVVEGGTDPERVSIVPYGVDVDVFSPVEERQDDVFRVLFVGYASRRKGLRYLVEAWGRLGLPDSELLVVGGADAFGRRLLESTPGCRWVGNVPRIAVHRAFRASDVFVLPSLCEGSALVTYEAMASSLPVITTPNSGSVVRNGQDGYVVPARDVDALCERLHALWADRELGRRLGRSGRELVASSYTWAHYRRRLVDVYEALA